MTYHRKIPLTITMDLLPGELLGNVQLDQCIKTTLHDNQMDASEWKLKRSCYVISVFIKDVAVELSKIN